ncbi:MAG: DUF5329 family protein [Deltaproteobacteria bacterium]|nr:DUF5329 family protein [Deltaproteobacteria bacterium]
MTSAFLRFTALSRFGRLILGLGWLILTLGCGPALADDLTSAEKKKIEALISGVEQMTDAVFVRNGKDYSASLAAEFLRRKWKSRRSEIHSAADFINQVASFSSTTGKPYSIRWSDGKERPSAEYFKSRLALLEGRIAKPAG